MGAPVRAELPDANTNTIAARKALILRKLLKAMYKPISATSQHDVTNHSVYIFKTFRLVKKQFEGLLATTRASLPNFNAIG